MHSQSELITNQPDHESPWPDCTWQLVLCVTGITLMRSHSITVKALGAGLTTFSLIKAIKKTRCTCLMAGGGSSKDKKTMVENGTGKLRSLKERLSFSREKTPAENLDASLSELLPENTVKSSINGSDKYRLLLENIVINGLLNIAEDKLNDDAFVEVVFSKAYELLPAPVRIVLKREWCLSYLQSQKAPILKKLQLYRADKLSPAELSALPQSDSEKAASQVSP